MRTGLDLSRGYGIVLEGGGARGSYQVGAWKALREAGILIKGIAGASVGALNGAMICMDDLERAEHIWEEICYSRVMDVDDDLMDSLKKRDLKSIAIPELLADIRRVLKDRGFDITPLRKLIQETIDEERIRASQRELFVSAISLSELKPLVIDLKETPEGEMGDMLLASAYLPAFKLEKLGGKLYLDGGGVNNVPIDVLADRGYQDIIVIRIYGPGLDTEKYYTVPEGVTVHHIAPRQSLGGILEFDKKKARRNMELGYLDGQRLLYGLAGKRYYIDAPESEVYYFDRLMTESGYLLPELEQALGQKKRQKPDQALGQNAGQALGQNADQALGQNAGLALGQNAGLALGQSAGQTPEEQTQRQKLWQLFKDLGRPEGPDRPGCRMYTEKIFPQLAKEMGLKEDWDYRELYLSIIEQLARKHRISRFKVYTVEALLSKLRKM